MRYVIRLTRAVYVAKTFCTAASLFFAIAGTASFAHAGEVYGPPDPSNASSSSAQPSDADEAYRLRPDTDQKTRRLADELEVTYQLLNALDAAQTISCMHKANCHEANPILGKHPSTGTIIGFKAGSAILHYTIGRYWIKRNPHEALLFEVGTVAVQGVICGLNFRYAF